MRQPVWIGLDLGTSGCRAIAIDSSEQIIARTSQAIAPAKQLGLLHEQNPLSQWQITNSVLQTLCRQLENYDIQAIAIDATSGSILLFDRNSQSCSQVLMYNDARATNEAEQISRSSNKPSAAHGASSGLAKLLYLLQHHPVSTPLLMHQADWINYNLGAEIGVTDYNNALKSGYDAVNGEWPAWISSLLPHSCLPSVVAPGSIIGSLKPSLAKQWHLPNTPNIIAGTTDSVAAFIATEAQQPGEAVTSLGSTLVLKIVSDQPIFVPEQGIYSHKLGHYWLLGGASNSGGQVLRHFFTDAQLQSLSNEIDLSQTPPDYYPLLTPGERFPICDSQLAPRICPRPKHDSLFLHGLLDGIARIEALGYQQLAACGGPQLKSVRSVGGGANNQIWQTIRQHYLGVPFITPPQTEAAYGSARLARDQLQQY